MAQHDYVIANGTGAAVRSDLNNALAAIVSQNSGATEPATMYAYQFWADTTTGLLKLRNAANNAWITLRQLDGDFDTVPVENGTASAPSIYFRASGTDTGFYSSGTDALDFTTAGTRRLGISSSGDIIVYGGNTTLNDQGDLRFADSDSSNWVAFQGPATVSSNVTWTLPSADGTSGQVLSTNGSGTLSWATASGTSDKISEGNTEAEVVDTGVDGHFKVTTEGTERARIDSSGRLLVGTSTSPSAGSGQYSRFVVQGNTVANSAYLALQRNEAATSIIAGEDLGIINFNDSSGNTFAEISAYADANAGSGDYPGRLVFSTCSDGSASPSERMRINSTGNVLIAGTNDTPAQNNVAGLAFKTNGQAELSVMGAGPLILNRGTNDGTLVALYQAGTEEGTISVSGNTVSYNQFLGSHWAALTDWSRPEIKIGTILETINELTDWKYAVIEVEGEQKKICYNGMAEIGSTITVEYEGEEYEGIVELETDPEFNKAVKVKVNDTAASKAVYGVFVGWNNDSNGDGGTWNDMYVGAVGNYVIRMAAGQEPEIGDLVEADGTGCAVVQDDDIIRTKTVAKITSTIPQVTYDDGSFLVTCVLYCG
jgi:hypothetical protein